MDGVMPRERDNDSGKYTDAYTNEDLLEAIREHGGAAATLEIAEMVGCHRDTARRRLNNLTEAGKVQRRDVGDAALWLLADDE